MFVFVEPIAGFGVFDLGGFLQRIDQFLQLGIVPLSCQFRLDLRTNRLERLGLAGRLRLALEGINGLVAGGPAAIERYRAAMEAQPLFAGIQSVTIPPRCNLGTRPNPNSSPSSPLPVPLDNHQPGQVLRAAHPPTSPRAHLARGAILPQVQTEPGGRVPVQR